MRIILHLKIKNSIINNSIKNHSFFYSSSSSSLESSESITGNPPILPIPPSLPPIPPYLPIPPPMTGYKGGAKSMVILVNHSKSSNLSTVGLFNGSLHIIASKSSFNSSLTARSSDHTNFSNFNTFYSVYYGDPPSKGSYSVTNTYMQTPNDQISVGFPLNPPF